MTIMNTLRISTKNNDVSDYIKRNISLFDCFEQVYLFGSILKSNKTPNDIDILLIYSEYSNPILNKLKFICSALENVFGLPVDLTVLSAAEERETKFLKRILPYLKIK